MFCTSCGVKLEKDWAFCPTCGKKVEPLFLSSKERKDLSTYDIEKRDFSGFDTELFEKLRKLRLRIAQEKNVPAYFVFDNKTLKEIVLNKPKNYNEFLEICGVGESNKSTSLI